MKLLTLAEAIKRLRENGVTSLEYKHLPPAQIIRLANEGRVSK